MRGRRREATFAETLDAVRSSPRTPAPEPVRGRIDASGHLVDPDGREHRRTAHDVSPAAALAAAAGGARVVWDPCGCGGSCGTTWFWFDAEEVASLVASGAPRVRRRATRLTHLSIWADGDGHVLVLAVDDVRWGDLLA
ncbi:hypothetical protein ACUN7V_20095 [Quadrisphaera oryzae]|uniref:hypothetical protein n=1 Tax=Quadrisphaera TaxID=317661 RepID=UPI001648C590|nr:hypothetical protein [Quadrisphaera sp. RL12-1S]MBC3761276.1 hypothetical protein [Quadrisphaera sp. RL12-1S]